MAATSQRLIIHCSSLTRTPRPPHARRSSFLTTPCPGPHTPPPPPCLFVVLAASKKQMNNSSSSSSSRTGRFDSKNRRSSSSVSIKEDEEEEEENRGGMRSTDEIGVGSLDGASVAVDKNGVMMPQLPGEEPDFWEGPQWDALGFFVQYMWAFGVVFALIACGIAVATYNEGATDFKDTPVYKESIQSREFLEEPEGSSSEVFDSNPTDQAPSVE